MKFYYEKENNELTIVFTEAEQRWLQSLVIRRDLDAAVNVANMVDKDNTDYSPSEKKIIYKAGKEIERRYKGFVWQMRNAWDNPGEEFKVFPITLDEDLPGANVHF